MILAAMLAAFVATQTWLLWKPDGTMERHGFWNGFDVYTKLSLSDPTMTAALVDLQASLIVILIIAVNGIPRGRGYWPLLIFAVLAGIVFPGFTALAFLLLYWRHYGQFRPAERG